MKIKNHPSFLALIFSFIALIVVCNILPIRLILNYGNLHQIINILITIIGVMLFLIYIYVKFLSFEIKITPDQIIIYRLFFSFKRKSIYQNTDVKKIEFIVKTREVAIHTLNGIKNIGDNISVKDGEELIEKIDALTKIKTEIVISEEKPLFML